MDMAKSICYSKTFQDDLDENKAVNVLEQIRKLCTCNPPSLEINDLKNH